MSFKNFNFSTIDFITIHFFECLFEIICWIETDFSSSRSNSLMCIGISNLATFSKSIFQFGPAELHKFWSWFMTHLNWLISAITQHFCCQNMILWNWHIFERIETNDFGHMIVGHTWVGHTWVGDMTHIEHDSWITTFFCVFDHACWACVFWSTKLRRRDWVNNIA